MLMGPEVHSDYRVGVGLRGRSEAGKWWTAGRRSVGIGQDGEEGMAWLRTLEWGLLRSLAVQGREGGTEISWRQG